MILEPPLKVTCPCCQNLFVQRNVYHKFCSESCRKYKPDIHNVCFCGKKFITTIPRTYCSADCAKHGYRNKAEIRRKKNVIARQLNAMYPNKTIYEIREMIENGDY